MGEPDMTSSFLVLGMVILGIRMLFNHMNSVESGKDSRIFKIKRNKKKHPHHYHIKRELQEDDEWED